MTTLEAASTLGRVDTKSRMDTGVSTRIAFLDHIRTLMVLLVVVYHAVASNQPNCLPQVTDSDSRNLNRHYGMRWEV